MMTGRPGRGGGGHACLVRLLGSSPDSSFWLQIPVWTASHASQSSVSGFWPVSRATSRLQGGFRIRNFHFPSPVSDSGLDLLRSLLNLWFLVPTRALLRLHGSNPDSGFWFRVLVWTCSIPTSLASQFLFSHFWVPTGSHAIAQRQPGFRFRPAGSQQVSFASQLLVSSFRPSSRAIVWVQPEFWFHVSSSRFRFGPARLASPFLVSGFWPECGSDRPDRQTDRPIDPQTDRPTD